MQFHRLNCHPYSISLRVTIHAGSNQRKSNCFQAFFFCKIQRVFIIGSKKCLCFRWSIFKINRPNSMDHKTGRKIIALCKFCYVTFDNFDFSHIIPPRPGELQPRFFYYITKNPINLHKKFLS